MNIQSPEVIRLLRGPESIEVDEQGYPVDWPYLEGMVDLFCVDTGLPVGVASYLCRYLLGRSGRRTHKRIPENERVLICRVLPDHAAMAEFTNDQGPVCGRHVNWRPPPARCTCGETPHQPGCPMWSLSDVDPNVLQQGLNEMRGNG